MHTTSSNSNNYYNSKAIANISNIKLSPVSSLKARTSFSNKKSQELEICLLMGAFQILLGALIK
jgi:hypothetical protein